jgi:hypothetical protein
MGLKTRQMFDNGGKSWVDRDPLQKIKILSESRMRELVRTLVRSEDRRHRGQRLGCEP